MKAERTAQPRGARYAFSSATEAFEQLPEHVDPSRIATVAGRIRFEIVGPGTWTVTFDGAIATPVRGKRGKPDCRIEVAEDVFLELLRGERNADTAFLQGLIKVWGDHRACAALHSRAGFRGRAAAVPLRPRVRWDARRA